MDTTENDWQPEIGEYCWVNSFGITGEIKFGKIIGRSPERPESVFIVKCIEENDQPATDFITQRVTLIDKGGLRPIRDSDILEEFGWPTMIFGDRQAILRRGVQDFYRKKALEFFKKKLEQALKEIENDF